MTHPTKESKYFYIDRLVPLVDGNIESILYSESDYEDILILGFIIKKTNGETVKFWMLSDDEGNAGASFLIEPYDSE